MVLVHDVPAVPVTAKVETPASEDEALRDLVLGVERAAPLLDTNPARCRAMVGAAIRRYDAARAGQETGVQ